MTEEPALLPPVTVGPLSPLSLCSHEILCSFSVPASYLRMLLDQASIPDNLQDVLRAPRPPGAVYSQLTTFSTSCLLGECGKGSDGQGVRNAARP